MKFEFNRDGKTIITYGMRPGATVHFHTAKIYGRVERQTKSNFRRAFSESLTEMNIKPKGQSFRLDDITWRDGFIEFHSPDKNSRWLYEPNTEHAGRYLYWLAYAGTAVPYPFTIYSCLISSTRVTRERIISELALSASSVDSIVNVNRSKLTCCVIKDATEVKKDIFDDMFCVSHYVDRYTMGDFFIALERPVMTFGLDRTRVFWSHQPFGLSAMGWAEVTGWADVIHASGTVVILSLTEQA